MKKLLFALAVSIAVAFTGFGAINIVTSNERLEIKEVELRVKSVETKKLKLQLDILNEQLKKVTEDKNSSQESVEKLRFEIESVKQKNEQLQKDLTAKKESKTRLTISASVQQVSAMDVKHQLMASAGIAPSDWQHVDRILGQESSWKVDSVNSIGCIGFGQACPSGNKAELESRCPDWRSNAECQMKVWNDYAIRRYGNWAYAAEWKFCTDVCHNEHTGATVNKHGEPWW